MQTEIQTPALKGQREWLDRPLLLSINPRIIDKNVNGRSLADGFENCELTIEDLIALVSDGAAYCAQVRNGYRKEANFIASGILSVDIDDGQTLQQLLRDPFVQTHATLVYTTASHRDDAHRVRVVFALERPITDSREMRAATKSVMLRLRGDPSTVDPSRMFYGSTGCWHQTFDRGIATNVLEQLVEQGRNAHLPWSEKGESVSGRSRLSVSGNLALKLPNGTTSAVALLERSTPVHCPYHHDESASAFIVVGKQGDKGIHCSACRTTYWVHQQSDGFDFTSFDRVVRAVHDETAPPEDVVEALLQIGKPEYLQQASITYSSSRYLQTERLPSDLTFIKSPKGTGKTELLKRLVSNSKGRVLLVGHRQSLIQQMCDRLGLNCYLKEPEGTGRNSHFRKRFGVCLDSIAKASTDQPYDYVLIDESEQVLAHVLSATLEGKRNNVFQALRHLIANAKNVVALDADLGWVSFLNIVEWVRAQHPDKKAHILINDHVVKNGQIEFFNSKSQLVGDIHRRVGEGHRCYVTSNSRKLVTDLHKSLETKFPATRLLLITRDTSSREEVQNFLDDPANGSRSYDCILCSPSVSSGVDISFPDEERVFDVTYGLFEARPLTHFECDQQLARVRHPKAIKVYVSNQQFDFETNFDVVLDDTLSLQMMDYLVKGFDKDGRIVRDREDAMLRLIAMVLTHQRASANQLRENFLDLKRHQGWQIDLVGTDSELQREGASNLRIGAELSKEEYRNRIVAARTLGDTEYCRLDSLRRKHARPSEGDMWALRRAWIERFYRQPITPELIELDDDGKFRDAVRWYEFITGPGMVSLGHLKLEHGSKERDALSLQRSDLAKQLYLVEAYSKAGIYEDGQFLEDRVISLTDLKEFTQMLTDYKKPFELAFDKQLNVDYIKSPIKQLSSLLGYVGLGMRREKKTRKGNLSVYLYRIDVNKINLMNGMKVSRFIGKT